MQKIAQVLPDAVPSAASAIGHMTARAGGKMGVERGEMEAQNGH